MYKNQLESTNIFKWYAFVVSYEYMKTKWSDLDTCELAASTQKTHHLMLVFLVNSVEYEEQRNFIRSNHMRLVWLSNKADTEWFEHICDFSVDRTYLFDLRIFAQIVSGKCIFIVYQSRQNTSWII